MQQISLIHPIYLDVPMLVSFAAAIQGGLSFGAEITHEKEIAQADGTKLAGEIGVGKLLSSLFQVSIKGQGTELEETKDTETRKESKAHTESSIAIILYDQLRRSSGYLTQPKTLDEFSSLVPGTLVELHGTLLKNAVDAAIDYIDAVREGLIYSPLLMCYEKRSTEREARPCSNRPLRKSPSSSIANLPAGSGSSTK